MYMLTVNEDGVLSRTIYLSNKELSQQELDEVLLSAIETTGVTPVSVDISIDGTITNYLTEELEFEVLPATVMFLEDELLKYSNREGTKLWLEPAGGKIFF